MGDQKSLNIVMDDNNNFDKVIHLIAEKLDNTNWAFVGSVNLYIRGLPVQPRDIDILTTVEGIRVIDKILEQCRTKEIYFAFL